MTRLVHDIECAFQRKEKFGSVFIDLTAAYDTVWHRGLYRKLLKTLPDVKLVKFIMLLIQDRTFVLETSNGQRSKRRRLRNGLPQGSVLAPTLFNIYTADMPVGECSQYTYADDTAIGFGDKAFSVVENALEKDLSLLSRYFHKWHLKLSLPKTVCSVFHLANRCANTTLNITLDGTNVRHDPNPKYLGVTLDRSLAFKPHIQQVAAKTAARVNLLKRLAGTGWGANFTTLRTSTLALAYSTAEYAAPAWSHSSHTASIDVVLNTAMRLISGALPSTPVESLPILSGIPPPELRRNFLTLKLACKSADEPTSLIPPSAEYGDQRLKLATECLGQSQQTLFWNS